ncbi:MAG: hypothetical protein V1907_01630 [Candidatus Kerfeldbacteria bacterium]
MGIVDRYKEVAVQPRFQGWPLVGEYELGPKIPFFGQVLMYKLQTGNGVEEYVSLLRHFGWSVVFGVTEDREVITIVQWKPGANQPGWELPPGGIGKVPPSTSESEIRDMTQAAFLKETGYSGGMWERLGHVLIETGKFRGSGPDDHGLPAHLYMATGLRQVQDARSPNPNEIIETLMVPLAEFPEVVGSGLFVETSAVACALLALRKLGL